MVKVTDLYLILKAYAAKINSPYIAIDTFLVFLEKYARQKSQEQPEWGKWLINTNTQFWSDFSGLVETEKCVLIEDSSGGQIYMPFFYTDMLREIYRDLDKDADMPFPNEESLGITIPENQIRIINLKADLGIFFKELKESTESKEAEEKEAEAEEDSLSEISGGGQIVKLIFPDDRPSALLLPAMIPQRLVEAAFLKARHYLRSRGNREFVLHKLTPHFQNKEKYLRDIIDQILIRPLDCLNTMKDSGDFSYVFWTYFCNLVKADISKRSEILNEDTAAIQAANVIEVCNGFYRDMAVKKREREIAFRNLELSMGKPPYHFTKEEILKFATDKGVLLLGMYSTSELESYIRKKTSESVDNELPEWFILNGEKGQQWFVRKDKYLTLCGKMLVNIFPLIKKTITKRWTVLLKEFKSEPAMEKDAEYEKMLGFYTKEFNPLLTAILEDKKLLWVFEETERLQGAVAVSLRFFKAGNLLPLSALYALPRRNMIADTKMLLPFWYSTPVLTAILAFFRRLFGKKKKKSVAKSLAAEEITESKVKNAKEIHIAAEVIKENLVPKGQSLDDYLAELEVRWNRLLDAQSRQNLNDDIQALVRDNLRKILRVHKTKRISQESLEETTRLLISSTPALRGLSGQDSLCLYIQLYMVKMLLNVR